MTERDFAYWLQGYFELSEAAVDQSDMPAGIIPVNMSSVTLNHKQIKCIKNHINLVRVTVGSSVLITSIEALLDYNVEAMRKVLNAHFEHVIDPEHPDQDAANSAHNGGQSTKPLMRC